MEPGVKLRANVERITCTGRARGLLVLASNAIFAPQVAGVLDVVWDKNETMEDDDEENGI